MTNQPTIQSLSVNIVVKSIEPSLNFWAAVGFNPVQTVPEDGPDGSGPLGFAIMGAGDQQFMLQSVASIKADIDIFSGKDLTASPVLLYIRVEDIDTVTKALAGYDQAFPKRETFYGATEVGYFTPDGTQVTFAQFQAET